MSNDVSITVRVGADLSQRLREIAAQERRTLSQLIRLVLEDYVRDADRGR